MNGFSRALFFRVLLGALVLVGCAPQRNTTPAVTAIGEPTGATVTTMVGPAGGTVRSADGQLELIVPAGALAAETALTVTPISVTSPGGLKSWRLGPEGTTFSQSATVKMSFTDREVSGSTREGIRIAYQDAERRWLAATSSTLDGNTIAVQTPHLSDWSLVLGWQIIPAWVAVEAGQTIALRTVGCHIPSYVGEFTPIAECDDDQGLNRNFANASVNGIPGGNAEVGTVQGGTAAPTYTAPRNPAPMLRVAVSVEFAPKEGEPRVLLVSNIGVFNHVFDRYAGDVNYHLKYGGPGTSTLPVEYRMAAPVRFNLGSSATSRSYDLEESVATLLSFSKENGVANCTCAASNVPGIIQASSGAMTLREGGVESLQLNALFTVPVTCTGSTDPACADYTTVEAVAWSLTDQNPSCINSVTAGYDDASRVAGSWSSVCPTNSQLLGRVEETSWSLNGSR